MPADAPAFLEFSALPWRVVRLLHLRSAGRAGEHAALDELLAASGMEDLASVGAWRELALADPAPQRALVVRLRPSEAVIAVLDPSEQPAGADASALLERCKRTASAAPWLHAVEGGDGFAAFRLQGRRVREVLRRLADAGSLPPAAGTASRLRLADLAATLLWCEDDGCFLLVDALYRDHLARWLAHAVGGLDASPPFLPDRTSA